MIDECFSKDTVEEIIKSLVSSVAYFTYCVNTDNCPEEEMYTDFRKWRQAKRETDGLDRF